MAMALRPEDYPGRGAGAELGVTLRLCVVAFDKALALEDIPRPFRAVVRACKTLCLDALRGGKKARQAGRAQARRAATRRAALRTFPTRAEGAP
jgi:hypothetical protein